MPRNQDSKARFFARLAEVAALAEELRGSPTGHVQIPILAGLPASTAVNEALEAMTAAWEESLKLSGENVADVPVKDPDPRIEEAA